MSIFHAVKLSPMPYAAATNNTDNKYIRNSLELRLVNNNILHLFYPELKLCMSTNVIWPSRLRDRKMPHKRPCKQKNVLFVIECSIKQRKKTALF